ncbi:hypothetical protein JCM10207_008678 [Rhodosporidiobolus poonsookiae]
MAPVGRGTATGQQFACEEPGCDKTFTRKEYLARHHRSKHSKERPFQCHFCERGFSRSDLLKRHFQTCAEAKAQREGSNASDEASTSQAATSSVLPVPPADPGLPATSSAFLPPVTQTSTALPPARALYDYPGGAFPIQLPVPPTNSMPTYDAPYQAPTTVSDSSASPDFFGASPASFTTNATSAYSPDSSSRPDQGVSPASQLPSVTLPALTASMPTLASTSHAHQPSLAPASAPSPPISVFKPGVSNATLAPGLSGTGSFTQDEVLASEVLRDLMTSPIPGGPGPGSGCEVPWHGAKAAAKSTAESARNEAVSLVDANGANWGYFDQSAGSISGALTPRSAYLGSLAPVDVSDHLEYTPAAQQLAEYFNKGGVGGITALDLGFSIEPTIFPDFIINPQPVHTDDADRRFVISEQKFCLGYLYPWHVPPVQVLSSYAKKATRKLLPAVPVLHAATVDMGVMPSHTAFALTVAGGAYEPEGQAFSNEMTIEKRVFLVRGFQAPEKTFEDRFASLQSLLLYQLLGLFHRDEQQRLLSQSFHSALIFMLRSLDMPTRIKQAPLAKLDPNWTPEEIEREWKQWVQVETWRRVTFIVFLTDLENAVAAQSSQHLALSDMDLDLPASDRMWNAESALEWHKAGLSDFVPPPISFLAAIRALMAKQEPEPFSPQGLLLAELGSLSSFPLLILSRTLSFLEKKTEEALAQVDPFKNLLGGIGVVEDRQQENREVLTRIRRGRATLRRLPGGIARGGGESWFQDVMPTAAALNPDGTFTSSGTSPSTASSTSMPPTPASATNEPLAPPVEPTLAEMLAEFDPQPYKPFHGAGGAVGNETYEAAQERFQKHAAKRTAQAFSEFPEMLGGF